MLLWLRFTHVVLPISVSALDIPCDDRPYFLSLVCMQNRFVSRIPSQLYNQEGLSTDAVNGYMFAYAEVSEHNVTFEDALNCACARVCVCLPCILPLCILCALMGVTHSRPIRSYLPGNVHRPEL